MVALTQFIAVGSLVISAVYARPRSTGCHKLKADITLLSQEVPQVSHFCNAYLNSDADESVVQNFDPARLHRTCECITANKASIKLVKAIKAPSRSAAGVAAASVCSNARLAKVLSGIKNVTFFCQNFNPSVWNSSPIFGVPAATIQQACACVLTAATAPVSKTTASPTSTPSPVVPLPFKFCPTNTAQLTAWKGFCKTPLWKLWACSCSTVAQVCYPGQTLTWCPAKSASSSAPSSIVSSTTTASSIASSASTTTTATTTVVPSTTTTTTTTVAPTTTSEAPVVSSSTTEAPVEPVTTTTTTTTDAPTTTTTIVAPTTTSEAPVVTSSTTDAPVEPVTTTAFVPTTSASTTDAPTTVAPVSSSTSSEDGSVTTTSSTDAAAST